MKDFRAYVCVSADPVAWFSAGLGSCNSAVDLVYTLATGNGLIRMIMNYERFNMLIYSLCTLAMYSILWLAKAEATGLVTDKRALAFSDFHA